MYIYIHIYIHIYIYVVRPKSNERDLVAQPRRARKGKWGSRQMEVEPKYTF